MGTTALYVGIYNASTSVIDWISRYDYTDMIDLTIEDGLGSNADAASWIMRFDTAYAPAGNELPLSGQIARILIDGTKVFEGVMHVVENNWLFNGTAIELRITANSYVSLIDRHLVIEQAMPIAKGGERIRAILEEYVPDFATDLTGIADGPTVQEETYDYQTVSSVLSGIAGRCGYLWYVDFDKKVHYFADLDEDAPITEIDLDTDTTVGDVAVTIDASQIANVIVLKDFVSKSPNRHTHNATGDGNSAFFPLPLGPFDLTDTKVWVNPEGYSAWIERTVVEDPNDGRNESIVGQPGMAYVCLWNRGLRFPTSDLPGSGDKIKAEFNPEIPNRVTVVFDEDSITEFARREGGDGHHELVVSVSDFHVSDDSPVEALGELMLRRKAWPIVSGSFSIMTTTIRDWEPGETFTIISEKRDIFDLQAWVASDYETKSAQRVWVTSVTRKFRSALIGGIATIQEYDTINFTSQPYEEM